MLRAVSYPAGKPRERITLVTNTFSTGPTIVETDRQGVVKVGALNNEERVLIGPGTGF